MAALTSTATWLVDTSALARLAMPEVDAVLRPRIDAGQIAVTATTWLEVGFSARSKADHQQSRQVLDRLQLVYGTPRSERRSLEVQRSLIDNGQHRSVKVPDLLVAAVAETDGLTVLHYDADFDRIAAVTGQPTEWIVAPGSVA